MLGRFGKVGKALILIMTELLGELKHLNIEIDYWQTRNKNNKYLIRILFKSFIYYDG